MHVCVSVCLCVYIREASTLVEDLKGLVEELEQDQQMSLINVELVDDELARVYASSNKAQVHCVYTVFLQSKLMHSADAEVVYQILASTSLLMSLHVGIRL